MEKKYLIYRICFNFNKYAINISIIVCYKDYTWLRFVWSDFQFTLSEASWQKNLTLTSVCFIGTILIVSCTQLKQKKKYIYKAEKINICFHYKSSETEITIDKIIIKIKSTLFIWFVCCLFVWIQIFCDAQWNGGYESIAFNRLLIHYSLCMCIFKMTTSLIMLELRRKTIKVLILLESG